ncbi:hypothetical protein [Xanthomonas vesicatoria]|uniref:hypothetical protein n=1 Tax=Xanthomonas vesicatoria TaxID=56460 RepID=UPI00126A1A9A|nr:hypothetical protein [Xanthomonas vesicatoria]
MYRRTQYLRRVVAVCQSCMDGRALCGLRLLDLRGSGSEDGAHRRRWFELQGVCCICRCCLRRSNPGGIACAVGLRSSLRKPPLHTVWRRVRGQRVQQCGQAIFASTKALE